VIPIDQAWMTQITVAITLMSLRLLGMFIAMPMFGLRVISMRLRVALSLAIAIGLAPGISPASMTEQVVQFSYVFAATELLIGLMVGFLIRLGFLAIEFLAEVLSIQSGLSFAASTFRDPVLQSGLMGELLGMVTLAIAFLMNVHLVVLDLLIRSFKVIPFGQFPKQWDVGALVTLIQHGFVFGVVLALPAIVVYFLFNLTQGMLARVSPQMNLFSVGFAITVPVSFVVLALILPSFPEVVQRALEAPVAMVRQGLSP
jgi:flagellar biosynthesis protein FliR